MKTHRTTEKEAEHLFYAAIAAIQTPEEAQMLLEDLCTPAEMQAMVDRWRVVASIKAGKPYRQIYKETGVSVTTIGRVARCIMLGKGGYDLIYQRMNEKPVNTYENQSIKNRNSKKRPSKQ